MDINTFSTYFIDNAKKVIDPIAYAGMRFDMQDIPDNHYILILPNS